MSERESSIECHVTEYRNAKEMTQEALARACGLTRQAISQIEAGSYCPNSIAALRIAKALGCKVEDLFVLPEEQLDVPLKLPNGPVAPASRVNVVNVNRKWIAYPVNARMTTGFASANGILGTPSAESTRILLPREQIERTALVVGCDPGLSILGTHMERRSRDTHLLWLSASSQAALDIVRRSEAHIAGTHLPELESGENLRRVKRALQRRGGLVVAFARWEQGLMVRPGNPKSIKAVADLARKDVMFINREVGSGSRAILDDLLWKKRIAKKKVNGYERVTDSHLSVAHTIRFGGADAGIGLCAVAHSCGLDFIPLADARFDFVIPRDVLDHPAITVLLDLLQSQKLKSELSILPGYDVSCMGNVIAEL